MRSGASAPWWPKPHTEGDPLDICAHGTRATMAAGVTALERVVLTWPPIEGVVLRYGHLYGPGTGNEARGEPQSLHVDAAAAGALLAVEKRQSGIYSIAKPNAYTSAEKARHELGFEANYRSGIAG